MHVCDISRFCGSYDMLELNIPLSKIQSENNIENVEKYLISIFADIKYLIELRAHVLIFLISKC